MTHLERRIRSKALALLILTGIITAASADEPGFRPIFNGKDLTGWRVGKAELAGKSASDDGRFSVRDGRSLVRLRRTSRRR